MRVEQMLTGLSVLWCGSVGAKTVEPPRLNEPTG